MEDSTKSADQGYTSGFYADGSYLDHSHVPYLGSYGIELDVYKRQVVQTVIAAVPVVSVVAF